MKRQSGFTLIELIIVIVILGILAVTAAPQFFNFGSDARASTVRALEGSVKTASEMVHARAQIQQFADTDGTEGTGFILVRDNIYVQLGTGDFDFYAAATEEGIVQALNINFDGPNSEWQISEGTNRVVFSPSDISDNEECRVEYATTGDSGPVITTSVEEC